MMDFSSISERIKEYYNRKESLEKKIADPKQSKSSKEFSQIMKDHSYVYEVVRKYEELRNIETEINSLSDLICDDEMKDMATSELKDLKGKRKELIAKISLLLIPPDPLDSRDTIMEIRAGTGGDEATLFVADLMRMYIRYAEKKGWKTEILDNRETEVGGSRECIISFSGGLVYATLKYEGGVHRVQRIPITESSGRIHTSAVTVAVLPEAEEEDISLSTEDIRVDVYRSSGPGGQSVNTTDSAVRLTHIPTGTVVTCQDEKSQHKNKAKALRILKARLYEEKQRELEKQRAEERKLMVKSGDRSERIRTYNFPQNRVTDHRANLTLHQLTNILEGDLDKLVEPMMLHMTHHAQT